MPSKQLMAFIDNLSFFHFDTQTTKNTMATDNIYLVLDLFLDPAITDFERLQDEIQKKIPVWNRDPSRYDHQLQIGHDFLARSSPPGQYDGGSLESQAKAARTLREKEGREKAASYEVDGHRSPEETEALVAEYKNNFAPDTIKSWFFLEEREEYVFTVPEEPNYGDAKIVSSGEMKQIDGWLKIVCGSNQATLYDLLGLDKDSKCHALEGKAKELYDEAFKDPNKAKDVVASTLLKVLGKAKSIFANNEYKRGYDIALSRRPFYKLVKSRFEGFASKGFVLVSEYHMSERETWESGIDRKEARWLVYDYYIVKRDCPVPKRTNEEEVGFAKAAAKKAKEEAKREIAEAVSNADARIATAMKVALDKVNANKQETDTTIRSVREEADHQVAVANANANNAKQKQIEAEGKQRAAEEDARQRIAAAVSNADARIATTETDASTRIAAAVADANTQIEAAKKDARDKIDKTTQDAEVAITSAREEANRQVTEANAKQTQAEKNAAKAKFLARKEVKTKRVAAVAARKKAEADQKVAQTMKDEAHDETSRARVSVADALQKQTAAENTAMLKIAEATESQRWRQVAEKNQWRAIFTASIGGTTALVVALVICFYGLHSAGVAHSATEVANKKLSDFSETLDKRTAEATELAKNRVIEADRRIAAAEAAQNKALDDQRIAQADRRTAQDAHAKALEEQEAAIARWKEAAELAAVAERDKNIAIEKEKIAISTEERADEKVRKADGMVTEAKQIMQDAIKKEIAAERHIAAADERAKMERERRMGVEAMIQAGVPMQFPLEEHERNEEARDQRGVQTIPVSGAATPLPGYGDPVNPLPRTVTEILRSVVWHWCLEKEFGIEDESGNLVGEVTERPRTGYRASLQGSPLNDPKSISLYEPGYVPSLFPSSLYRRFMLSQTEVTQELWASVMGDNPSRFKDASRPVENVSWEDAQEFIAKLNEMKEKLGVPLGYEFTLPKEAEWELACRAAPTNAFREKLNPRTMTPFHFGVSLDHKQANIGNPIGGSIVVGLYPTNLPGGTNVVGRYPANLWGLQDMHGNVREWCQDAPNYEGTPGYKDTPGYGPFLVHGSVIQEEGFYRNLRGGSWSLSADQSRSDFRISGNPTRKHDDVGFRLCLAAAQ